MLQSRNDISIQYNTICVQFKQFKQFGHISHNKVLFTIFPDVSCTFLSVLQQTLLHCMISVFQHSKHFTIKSLYKKDYLDIVYHILKLS